MSGERGPETGERLVPIRNALLAVARPSARDAGREDFARRLALVVEIGMASPAIERMIAALGGDSPPQTSVFLVTGDLVVAEPQARKLADALAERAGCEVQTYRRPASLGPVLADLRTYSLFASAKVVLVTDSALLADRGAAADLVDQAADALPVGPDDDLGGPRRLAASRLLQALHVFGIDPAGDPEAVIGSLPEWALKGGRKLRKSKPRGRGKRQVRELAEGLGDLLRAARNAGLQGFAEGDLAELGAVIQQGLPEGHALVLAEHSAAGDHPLVAGLAERGAVADLGTVGVGKRGEFLGLDRLVRELESETGVEIERAAVDELARRVLRHTGSFADRQVDAKSTSRFAGEVRKLADLAKGGKITRQMVAEAVDDRGEEDVWQILDALGTGRGDDAQRRFRRLLASAEDAMAARLSFFALLAGFCRQLTAVAGMARAAGVPAGVASYSQFKSRWAPKLQGEPPAGGKNPLAGLHPFRLHRAYLAASRMNRDELAMLPWRVLETELQIKGESSEADVAVAQLMGRLAAAVRVG